MRATPEIAVAFVKQHEGLVLRVYDDARPKLTLSPGEEPVGALTAGYGHTGPDLHPGLAVTQEKAEVWLRADLETAARRLSERIGAVVDDLTEHQYAAIMSFVFNVGAEPGWTIWKVLKRRQFDQVPLELMKFVNARGRKILGLVRRRAAEVALWSTEEPGSEDIRLTSASLRREATPPTAADPTPPGRSATLLASAATAVAAAPAGIKEGIAVVEPYAAKSPVVGKMVGGMATLAALLALLVLVLTWLKKRELRQ